MPPSTQTLRIYLVDNSHCDISVDLESTTAREACVLCCVQLGLSKHLAAYYALYTSDDCIQADAVIPKHHSLGLYFAGAAKIVFRVRLFVPQLLNSTDPFLLHNLYLEASHQVVSGRFKCPASLLLRLASYQVLIKTSAKMQYNLGYDEPHHSTLTLTLAGQLCQSLFEYLPVYAFEHRKPVKWEADILKELKRIGNAERNPMRAYVENAKMMTTFGSTFFEVVHCSDPELDTPLQLGVGTMGITLFDAEFDHIKKRLRLDELQTWGYRREATFYVTQRKSKIVFEVRGDPAGGFLLLRRSFGIRKAWEWYN